MKPLQIWCKVSIKINWSDEADIAMKHNEYKERLVTWSWYWNGVRENNDKKIKELDRESERWEYKNKSILWS